MQVNPEHLLAVFVDKQEYSNKLIMLFNKNVRVVALDDIKEDEIPQIIKSIHLQIPQLKSVRPDLLVNGEIYFVKTLEDGILYNVEGENIKIKTYEGS